MLHRIDRGIRLPFPRDLNNISDGSKAVTIALSIETPHALTRVDVGHAVDGLATAVLDGRDFPVAVTLKLLTDGRDHRAEVLHAELGLSLSGGESLARTEVVDDLTSLAEGLGSGSHNDESPIGLLALVMRLSHRSPDAFLTCTLQVYSRIGCRQDALKSFLKETLDR